MRTISITLVCTLALALGTLGEGPAVNVAGLADFEPKPKLPSVEQPVDPMAANSADIEKLVKQLGSDNPKAREMASMELRRIGEKALPLLKKARTSGDAELRRRAELLHDEIAEEAAYRRVWRYGIDCMVEHMVRNRKKATNKDWKLVVRVADELRKDGVAKGTYIQPKPRMPYLNLDVLVADEIKRPKDARFFHLEPKRVLCESVTTGDFISDCLLLSSGEVKGDPADSVIFVNGDFDSFAGPVRSIIVCDGNIKGDGGATNSVLIARQSVDMRWPLGFQNTLILEKENPFSCHRYFFATSAVGLVVRYEKGELIVVEIFDRESPFKAAGFKQKDKIVTVDGRKIDSESTFRRLLRSVVVDGIGMFGIRRGDADLKIKVAFPPVF